MVGGIHLTTVGGRKPYPMGNSTNITDEMCVLAARHEKTSQQPDQKNEILVLLSQYQTIGVKHKPIVGKCFKVTVHLKNIPYDTWSWTQYENNVDKVLPVVNSGKGSGSTATLLLQMHGNSFSSLSITPGSVPEGMNNDGYPLGVKYTDQMKHAILKQTCVAMKINTV